MFEQDLETCPSVYLQYGAAFTALSKDQTAALLTMTRREDQMAPALRSSDWLPVCQSIDFIILLLD